jgi:hypothetical protein
MNNRVRVFILKNKFRLFLGVIRHMWLTILGLIAAGGVLMYQLLFAFFHMKKGVPLDGQYIPYVFYAVIILKFIQIFLDDTPVFKVNAATLLHTYNTALFSQLLKRKQFKSLLVSACLAFMMTYILRGFVIGKGFALPFVFFTMYLASGTLMAWIYYHGKRLEKWTIAFLFGLATLMFYKRSLLGAIILFVMLAGLEIWAWGFMKLNVPKYDARLRFMDTTAAAQSQNDMAKMHQLAAENRPQHAYGVKFHQFRPSKRFALTVKSLIEVMRIQKSLLIMIFIFLLAGWAFIHTNVLSLIPFLDNPELAKVLAAYSATSALRILYQITTEQMETVLNKRLLGLALPFSDAQVVFGYIPVPIIINFVFSILFGALFGRLSYLSFVFWLIINVIYLFSSFSCLSGKRLKKILNHLTNFLLWLGVYWYLMV